MNKIRRGLLIASGFISVGLGVVGAFLPVLPTVPFLLLASWCFWKSSPRYHSWLENHKQFGPIIRDFRQDKAIPKRIKIRAISLLWLSISATVCFAVKTWWLRVGLLVIAVGVTIHILSFKTKK